jgi:diguanylate cyclase (GGDEF)-like protein/PAS domain S-box-containing protein
MKQYNFVSTFVKIMLLLLLFTLTVVLLDSYQTYDSKYYELQEKIKDDSIHLSNTINNQIIEHLQSVEQTLDSIKNNDILRSYLTNASQHNKKTVEHLLQHALTQNPNIFQFRYIDKSGYEKIRVQKCNRSNQLTIVDDAQLQDKSNRYYVSEILQSPNGAFWYSNLDLNVENGKLDKPIRPTYRIGTNISLNAQVVGLLVVNIDMSSLLEKIQESREFDLSIFDHDGEVLIHYEPSKNWSRYLHTNYNIYQEYPQLKQTGSLDEEVLLFSLEETFKNGENLTLLLRANKAYIDEIESTNIQYIIRLLIYLFIPASIFSLLISMMIFNIFKRYVKTKKQNLRYENTIDKYVVTMTTDVNHRLTFVSEALCEISGFTKKELLGQKASIFSSGRMKSEHYKSIKKTIHSGNVWNGDLQNSTKDGKIYWLNSTIVPNFNDSGEIESFTALSMDITDKKIIEKISQTDKLTQLYNRTKMDDVLQSECSKFLRYTTRFSIILIDIDHFKSVNDTFGHNVGDSVLIELSNLLLNNIRKTDIVGRWGGEEFLIICTHTTLDGTITLAESLRKKVEEFEFTTIKDATVSLGVAETIEGDSIEKLLHRADENLYKAKDRGRNQVVSSLIASKNS